MALELKINGKTRCLDELGAGESLQRLIASLALKEDRIAVERNGEIVPKDHWARTFVQNGDRLEIVHFVGGGVSREESVCCAPCHHECGPA